MAIVTPDYDYTDGVVGAQISETTILHRVNQVVRVDGSENALTENQTARLFSVPKGTFVHRIEWKVITVEGSALTFDIGDYEDADDEDTIIDGWINGANGNSLDSGDSWPPVITQGTPSTIAPIYALGKLYTIDAWIGLKALGGAAETGVIDVWMVAEQVHQIA